MRALVFGLTALFFGAVLFFGIAGRRADHARTGEPARRIQASELARHVSPEDCWIAVEDGVYDVTRYIDEHPAPRETIVRACGTDATVAFATKNEGRAHSPRARDLLRKMRIGVFAR